MENVAEKCAKIKTNFAYLLTLSDVGGSLLKMVWDQHGNVLRTTGLFSISTGSLFSC